jgi:hypothetical protein
MALKKPRYGARLCVAESEGLFGAVRLTPAGPAYGRSLATNARVEPKASHQSLIHRKIKKAPLQGPFFILAESEGFEPSMGVNPYALSRGAPSATRPALLTA